MAYKTGLSDPKTLRLASKVRPTLSVGLLQGSVQGLVKIKGSVHYFYHFLFMISHDFNT